MCPTPLLTVLPRATPKLTNLRHQLQHSATAGRDIDTSEKHKMVNARSGFQGLRKPEIHRECSPDIEWKSGEDLSLTLGGSSVDAIE